MMNHVLSPLGGFVFMATYGAIIIGLTTWLVRRTRFGSEDFLLAGRRLGIWPAAMTVASSWIWAPALFVSAQKSYEDGLAGLFWFTFPNFLALFAFAPLAVRLRKLLPDGYTLPQLMRERYGKGVHILYVVQFVGLQVCSFAVQILGGAGVITTMSGLSFHVVAFMLVAITLTYTTMGGLKSTVMTDFIQMSLILAVLAIVIPIAVWSASASGSVQWNLAGVNHTNPWWVAYSFGIPTTIGLLAGPIGDQMHWQRAYAIGKNGSVMPTFFLASILFVIVPLSLSVLGFLAASPNVGGTWQIANAQMVAPIAVARLLPAGLALAYSLMVLAAMCSTLDSILSAVSTLFTIDLRLVALGDDAIQPVTHDNAGRVLAEDFNDESSRLFIGRLAMLLTAGWGLALAFVPEIKILHLFLFYGTFRASTMIPTVLTLLGWNLNRKAVFWAIGTSLVFGGPTLAIGNLLEKTQPLWSAHLKVTGSVLVIAIGFVVCVLASRDRRGPNLK